MKKALIILALVIGFAIALLFLLLSSTAPQYSGTLKTDKINDSVEVIFDKFGIPHIYAKNSTDAYFTLGYAHAQERLFQMVMIRRLSQGKLAEILGPSLIPVDKRMRTLGFMDFAKLSTKEAISKDANNEMFKLTKAYQDGVNHFIDNANLPIEFTMLGFKPEHFATEDIYTTLGFMALGFTTAITNEPIMQYIQQTLGEDYAKLLEADSISGSPEYQPFSVKEIIAKNILNSFDAFPYDLQLPYWEGSNSWLLSKDRSKSGKAIFANDTHIGYSQPSVWFEAYMEYPGFELYGYYLAGMPFAIIGHNANLAWGITIFPMDNMDLYTETTNPENSNQYLQNGEWVDYEIVNHKIAVKDSATINYPIKHSKRGPILSDAFAQVNQEDNMEVSLWWSLNHYTSTAVEATYMMNNARNIEDFEAAMPLIDILGLNIMYADIEDNIAWWATGNIPIRNNTNSKRYMDGATDTLKHVFYSFDKNPKMINPEKGYIITANNSPGMYDSVYVPGYYSPGYRAQMVEKLLLAQEKWNIEELKAVQTNVSSDRDIRIVKVVLGNFDTEISNTAAIEALKNWDGNYNIESVGATIFTRIVYEILEEVFLEKLGKQRFDELLHTYTLKANIENLINDESSIWWNGNQKEMLNKAITESIELLSLQLGNDVSLWQWGEVHQVEHVHAIGRKKPFNKIFNVGPFPKSGSNEVIDKEGFTYTKDAKLKIKSGPALRYLVDFSKPKQGIGIIPTGQSGNIMSPHYSDQALMFVNGEYRVHIMEKDELGDKKVLWFIKE